MGDFPRKVPAHLGDHLETLFVAAHELVGLLPLADVARSAPV